MSISVATLTAGLAAAGLGAAIYQLALTIRRLEKRLDEREAPPQPTPPPPRSRRAYFSALYPEAPAPRPAFFANLPGGRWVIGAGFFAVITVAFSLFASTGPGPRVQAPDPQLARLQLRVDSLASSLGQLKDSVQVTVKGPTPPRTTAPHTRNLARRAPSRPSGLAPAPLPPPPTLDSISHTPRTTP